MTSSARRHPGDDRVAVLGNRLARQCLDRPAPDLSSCAPLDVGLQDAGQGSAEAALGLRIAQAAPAVAEAVETGALVTVLSLRGAPHLHRRTDVSSLRAALAPASTDDLEATTGPLPDGVRDRDDPVAEVARAIDAAMGDHDALSKSDLSSATTPLLDDALAPWCVPCGAHHAIDGLFRLATLRARLHLVPESRTQTFARLDGAPVVDVTMPARETAAARRTLLARAAAVASPVDVEQVAAWLGWPPATVRSHLTSDAPPAVQQTENARTARLLPARDPWLRGSDRAWLLGNHVDRRGEVFRSLGAPGVVLRGGEVVGTWRQRAAGSRRLAVEIDAWTRLTRAQRDEVAADAALVAAVRRREPAVRWT